MVENVRNLAIESGQWMRGSFYERSVYINNNFDILFSNQENELLNQIFLQLFSNKDLVEISTIHSTISLILQNKPILVDVPHEYNAQFPFSYSINQRCYSQKSFLRSFRSNEKKEEEEEGIRHIETTKNKTNLRIFTSIYEEFTCAITIINTLTK